MKTPTLTVSPKVIKGTIVAAIVVTATTLVATYESADDRAITTAIACQWERVKQRSSRTELAYMPVSMPKEMHEWAYTKASIDLNDAKKYHITPDVARQILVMVNCPKT